MAIHRIRLVETTTMTGSVSFDVEAETIERAAVAVLTAYRTAQEAGHTSVTLPDHQNQMIERDKTVSSSVVLQEVDAEDRVLRQLQETELKRAMI